MKPDEAKAILKPLYDEIQKNIAAGKLEENVKFLHPECVGVHKGKAAYYGKEQILTSMKKFFEEHQPKNIKRTNETYCGCDCCICVSYVATFDTTKGSLKVDEHQIWKKIDGQWKLYHMEYDVQA